jgi:hypothetical protein
MIKLRSLVGRTFQGTLPALQKTCKAMFAVAHFAANVLSARGALLSALAHFFECGDWGSAFETGAEGQRLTAEDQLFIFMQAGQYLTATRGLASSEARICYKRAESLCHSLDCPLSLHAALMVSGSIPLTLTRCLQRCRLLNVFTRWQTSRRTLR